MITIAKSEASKDLSSSIYRFVYLALGECIDFSRFVLRLYLLLIVQLGIQVEEDFLLYWGQRMTSLHSILLFIGDEFLKYHVC